jgi:4,5-dihydroxyphthalate decarboxylase
MSSPPLQLSFASGLYDRMQALYTQEVRPQGIDLNFERIEAPRVIFDRMASDQAFDLCEMSCSEYISRIAAGDHTFCALPVFPSRSFRHSFITINQKSGIEKPTDLSGKRIGVPLYTMTAAVWIRGHLVHDYNVDLSNVQWVQGSINSATPHGEPTVMPMHRPISIEINQSSSSLSDLLKAQKIDAIMGTTLPNCIKSDQNIVRLFPDFRNIEKDYFKRTKIFPPMHLVVIKRSTFEKNPFIAQSLFTAFVESKNIALTRMKNLAALRYMLPWLADDLDELDEIFNGDPWPYGLEHNKICIDTLVSYMVEQGIISKSLDWNSLFLPVQ